MVDVGREVNDATQAAAGQWARIRVWDAMLRGEFDPPYLPSTDRTIRAREYNDLAQRAGLALGAVVVGAVTDRLRVDGFRTDEHSDADDLVWSWWQANAMDSRQHQAYTDAIALADGYVSVTPPIPGREGIPTFRVESPRTMWTVADPAQPSKLTRAYKILKDQAWIYDPDVIIALAREHGQWKVVDTTEHAAGEVPIIRFSNRLDSAGRSQSDLELAGPTLRRIQQTTFDRLMIQKSASWRQRYAAGLLVEKDEHGQPINPIKTGTDELIISTDPNTKFGDWEASSIKELLEGVDADIRHLSALTSTPIHLLSPTSISNVSAEALIALEAPLAARVAAKQLVFGEAWEQAMRLGGRIVGHDVSEASEVIWGDLEARSQAQLVDAITKLRSIGFPMNYLMEQLGMTPTQMERVAADITSEQASAAAAQAAAFTDTPPVDHGDGIRP